MSLDTEEHVRQTWGSHIPVLQAIMEIIKPKNVIECGCGRYSTPIISHHADSIVTIEHDPVWGKEVKKDFEGVDKHGWIVYPFAGVSNSTRRPDVGETALANIDHFYETLRPSHIDFLFVDTFTCARVPAMLHLSEYADLILLHDLEGGSPEHYNYELLGDTFDEWHRYRHAPEGFVNKTHQIPWTDLFSREPLDVERLNRTVKQASLWLFGTYAELEEID